MTHRKIDERLLQALGLSEDSALIILEEIDALRAEVAKWKEKFEALHGGYMHHSKEYTEMHLQLTQAKAQLTAMTEERDGMRKAIKDMDFKLDKMLEHCGDSECSDCAKIICPFEDSLHYHHDGCPSCATAPEGHESFKIPTIIRAALQPSLSPQTKGVVGKGEPEAAGEN